MSSRRLLTRFSPTKWGLRPIFLCLFVIPKLSSVALQNLSVEYGRCLKSQRGFVQGVLELKEQLDLDFVPEPLVSSLDPTIDKVFRICIELTQRVSKKEQNTLILRSLALEAIDTMYPEPEWVHIYTDGSLLIDSESSGAGVYCHLFSFYLTAEKFTIPLDGEVAVL
ncbi:hypothetical protein TNCV_4358131 [Trichonephila clavipes]|nr:hypothetical protein TNCV_4358131 [Trichonephila clavipes]